MTEIFNFFQKIINAKLVPVAFYFTVFLLGLCGLISFFDMALAVGILMLFCLTAAMFFMLIRAGIKDQNIYMVFLIGLAIHLGFVLFIYYVGFKPFGGGADFDLYDKIATEIAHRFSHGNFSLNGLYTEHFYPVLIGVLYMVTMPSRLIGQFFTAWLAALSITLIYVIVLEIGGTKKTAFLASILVSIYPSYLFFGSVLLKDTLVIPLVLAGIWLTLKMARHFSWITFVLFFMVLTPLINLRFYIGYALMAGLICSWPLLAAMNVKKKMIYWFVIIFLLGFSSFVLGDGYYGFNNFKKFLNPKEITYFREVVYANPPAPAIPAKPEVVIVQKNPAQNTPPEKNTQKPSTVKPSLPPAKVETPAPVSTPAPVKTPVIAPVQTPAPAPTPDSNNGNGSTFVLETGFSKGPAVFIKNFSLSFIYSLLGPFPWQFTRQRQVVALAETIPWYMLILFSLYGASRFIKRNGFLAFLEYYKFSLPLMVFGVAATGALALFINNYGIIARIRIPMFMCFICILCLSFNEKENHEKISYYWRRGIHWLASLAKTVAPGK